jgi:hypothetical protein
MLVIYACNLNLYLRLGIKGKHPHPSLIFMSMTDIQVLKVLQVLHSMKGCSEMLD